MEARGQAFYSPPPPLKGQPTTQPATQPATQSAADAAEIERLIRQLGGDTSAQREAAQQALVKIGPPAMEALRAAAADISAERAERAKAALRQIEEATAQEQIRRTNERFSAMLRQWAKAGRTDEAPPALRAGEIQRLIEHLANPKVAERNSAQQALV
jgi:1,2-phenylacetyl-CoA epoxidase catalytic subunit